ncbi:MAG: NDP-hexose 2,3-dehydratase family protein [bacterium]|nr:NDP-hexose 2,3-dehydratase family protein [bacterium]
MGRDLDDAFAAACDDSRVATPSPARLAALTEWLRDRTAAHALRVQRRSLHSLMRWRFDPATGDFGHDTGRFFRVTGCRWTDPSDGVAGASPMLVQPEVGLLGWLARVRDGVLQFLCQAKTEPGNPGGAAQVSTTVQATASNIARVHGGRAVACADAFPPGDPRVVVDVCATEHPDRFWQKVNRNVVRWCADDDAVPEGPDYEWLTLGDLQALLRRDYVVHMDARSVLACLPTVGRAGFARDLDAWRSACYRSATALESEAEVATRALHRWLAGHQARAVHAARLMPLCELAGWGVNNGALCGFEPDGWRVVGVHVDAPTREVPAWNQPLVTSSGRRHVLLVQSRGGVLHAAVRARFAPGCATGVELAPTFSTFKRLDDPMAWDVWPLLGLPATMFLQSTTRYHARHAEEGGRFGEQNDWSIVELPSDDATALAPTHQWTTLAQLRAFIAHGWTVSIELRGMTACLW